MELYHEINKIPDLYPGEKIDFEIIKFMNIWPTLIGIFNTNYKQI